MADDAMFSVEVGTRVLVYGKYAGVIRYVPSRRSAWIGVELDRAVGDNDGTLEGQRHFQSKPHHGVFVREEQLQVPFFC
uniref:CAP-Gly domain-containing protein n=1 Tax=Globisporangium ultimum (strain ATCC 200006 / CBS 805.95 / DAOM BR144) TaxID=431595 RepID=K3WLK2_GLOUD